MNNTTSTPPAPIVTRKLQVRGFVQVPREAVDKDGTPILLVPLPTGETVKVLPEDWERLKAQGHAPGWILNDNGRGGKYVRFARANNANTLTVARLIMDAQPGQVIGYRWGSLDLRRDHLYVKRGRRLADRLP